jgi:hypothetical protein
VAKKIVPLSVYFRLLALARKQGVDNINYSALARVVELDHRTVTSMFCRGLPEAVGTGKLKTKRHPYPPLMEVLKGMAPEPVDPDAPKSAQAPAPAPAPALVQAPAVEPILVEPILVEPQPAQAPAPAPAVEPIQAQIVTRSQGPVAGVDYVDDTMLRKQAVTILQQELRNLEVQRSAAQGLGVVSVAALRGLEQQLKRSEHDIQQELDMGGTIDVDRCLKRLARIAAALKVSGDLTEQATRTARLALGSPTEIIRLTGQAAPVAGGDVSASASVNDIALLSAIMGKLPTSVVPTHIVPNPTAPSQPAVVAPTVARDADEQDDLDANDA